ncbi:MAG: hypothetical protein ACJATP_001677 [Candidatus Azotimanducaceae bacterium]|jgi:hypothetical protein
MLLQSPTALAHGGGLDSSGGHTNRKTEQYHCHREPYISQHEQVEPGSVLHPPRHIPAKSLMGFAEKVICKVLQFVVIVVISR